jgi:hypothetical protein
MILFTIIAVCILLYTIFADDWLIYWLKRDVKEEHPVKEILSTVNMWFWCNVLFQAVNFIVVGCISVLLFFGLCFVLPDEKSQWEFQINALEDNLVTQGHFYGRRGYVDGELSYFYSRPFATGEKIGHMPANKTYVKYNNNVHPHVEVHNTRKEVPEWVSKVFFIDFMNQWSTEYYVLIVPDGTITNDGQYEIDMR